MANIAFRKSGRATIRVAGEIGFAMVALVLADYLVAAWEPAGANDQRSRIQAAQRLGVPFDTRTVSDVVRDLQREGVDALPGISGNWPQLPLVRDRLPVDFYPLSHASRATVVECNEGGEYLTYVADEYGFNNPPGLFDGGDLQIAIVGESLALGHCLPQQYSLAGRLREWHPRTANLALGGRRTLTQLASFREYVEPLEPAVVIWVVNPHFVEARAEQSDRRLTRYFEPHFSQDLIERQTEIDAVVRLLAQPVQAALDAAAEQHRTTETRWERMMTALRLPQVRGRLLPATKTQLRALVQPAQLVQAPASGAERLTTFRQSLTLAKQAADGWGGRLIVLITPIYAEVVADQVASPLRHHELTAAVKALGIPVVDAVPLFRSHPDPASLYTMGGNNHPTAEGHTLLAELVEAEIQRQPESIVPAAREDGV